MQTFTAAGIAVRDRIRLNEPIFADDFRFLAGAVTTAVPKLTIPSPSMVHARGGTAAVDRSVYPDLEEFWADLSAAYAAQVRGMHELGCRYLQLDDTSLAYLNDPAHRDALAAKGDDPATMHLRYIRQINAAIADRPADMVVTTHMCRGNFRSSWAARYAGWYRYWRRPARSTPVAWSRAAGLGEIQTSRQAGGMTSSSMRRRCRSSVIGRSRASTKRNRFVPRRRQPLRRAIR